MKNVARGSALSFLAALLVGFIYFQPKVEAVTILASDSQENIQKLNKKELFNNNSTDNNIERFDINVELETAVPGKAASKGTRYRATAYCLRGKTASGRYVRRGIVAADPRILRLGTRIQLTAGRYSGSYLVADTGGKIKGRILDIWVPSCKEARRWGRRTVYVKVLSKGKTRKTGKSKRRRKK